MIPRLAVLIDADNISAEDAPAVLARVAKLGRPMVRRIYGRPEAMPAWAKETRNELYEQRPLVSISSAKNGADIALTIDAMKMLHAGAVDAFCIVSNDRDFVPLAIELRASDKEVHAICKQSDAGHTKAFDTVVELKAAKTVKSVTPIVAAFRKIVTADKKEFGLSEAGKLLREVAPPDVVPSPGKGRLRKVMEKTEDFIFTGSGPSTRVRLK